MKLASVELVSRERPGARAPKTWSLTSLCSTSRISLQWRLFPPHKGSCIWKCSRKAQTSWTSKCTFKTWARRWIQDPSICLWTTTVHIGT